MLLGSIRGRGGFSALLFSRFSFSPIANQLNDRLFLPALAGKNGILGFRTAILAPHLYIKFLLPTIRTET
jgi:hypothetical protein